MAKTRLGFAGPAANYAGFVAKEEAAAPPAGGGYGVNYFGYPYYGQASAPIFAFEQLTLTADITTTASIISTNIVSVVLAATVTATASLLRLISKAPSVASVTVTGIRFLTSIVPALNVINGISRLLNGRRITRQLNPPQTSTTPIAGLRLTTRRITSGD